MARPQPAQKSNLWSTMLIMATIFLAMQVLFPRGEQKAPVSPAGKTLVTTADYLQALQECDQQWKEGTGQGLLGAYNNLVDADLNAKKITPAQATQEKIQGSALIADAFLKAGIKRNNSSKVRLAYQMMVPFDRRNSTEAAWTAPIIVFPKGDIAVTTTGKQLYTQITDTLSVRNKSDLIWGVIPFGYQLIDGLVHLTGANPDFSYAFAAFLLALAVRAVVYPLSQKQLMHSRQMGQLLPQLQQIKAEFKDDAGETQKRTMALYQEYGLNPLEGCLPAFVQMPLFFTVYQCMLLYQFTFAKGHFLWINPVTSAATNGFIARDLGHQDTILVIIYGITMTISTLLMPITDPTQQKQQRMIGMGTAVIFTAFMFTGAIPVVGGFVLYWTFTNCLATAQSLRAYRLPLPPLVKVNAPGGGVYPSKKKPQGRWMQMMEEMQRSAEEQKRKGDPDETSKNGKPHTNGSGGTPKAPKKRPTDAGNTKDPKKPASGGDAKSKKDSGTSDDGGSQGAKPTNRPKKRG